MARFRRGIAQLRRRAPAACTAIAIALLGFPTVTALPAAAAQQSAAPARPSGPCDIYAAAGTPCTAAHSTTRALYASYDGPLYQVRRQSDDEVRDIGVVAAAAKPVPDAGGYADAAAQDRFCAGTTCFITVVYDQSPHHNDLTQAPRGGFSGPAMGGANNLPIADMAPITIGGHRAYGVFIEPGMGLRNNDTRGIAVDDQPEGMYWVVNGRHFNNGCCFDYGNAETDSRDDGNGTMETAYFGNATAWYHGTGTGPWIMTDQENNLVGCVNPGSTSKVCTGLPDITSRFVTAVAKGEPHHWASLGGDAQQGSLTTMFDGPRVDSSYDPMRKQGAIVLGNGGDNSNGSQGTFYEGVMTDGYPSDATDNAVQDNVVAAKYDVQQLSLTPASATAAPPGLQTFAPGSTQKSTLRFTNTTGSRVSAVKLHLSVPDGWRATATDTTSFPSVAPGDSVSATFEVTAGRAALNGDLTGRAAWEGSGDRPDGSATTTERVRNTPQVKINEFRTRTGTNATDQYIELTNTGSSPVDVSRWILTQHPTRQAVSSAVTVPAGTRLPPGGHYVLGLSASGLAAPAAAGDTTLNVRSTTGLSAGDEITLGSGAGAETRTIAAVGTAAGANTTVWQPLPDGPVLTVPAGSTNVPVTSTSGFRVGQKLAIGHGDRSEVATVTAVGNPGTQARLAAAASAGERTIKVTSTGGIAAGDTIRLDIDSRIEKVTVASVGTAGAGGTGLELTAPLRSDHSSNLPFSARGTGITFTPATAHAHASNESVLPLGTGVTLDEPLDHRHAVDAPVRDAQDKTAGYQASTAPDQWFGGPALSPSAGAMVLSDGKGHVADSLNYGSLVDPWAAEGFQGTSGAGQSGCRVTPPGAGKSAGRFPDGVDNDSNCADFTVSNNPTPGEANKGFTLDPGPHVSLRMTTPGSTSDYIKHNDSDDLVITAPVTSSSPLTDKQDATWVETAGLADPDCVSFESVNKPGSYLRHQNFQFHLHPDDGSTLFSQDATFCEVPGNSGQGVSFRSLNFPTRYIRSFDHTVYIASDGGANPWDTTTSWADDSSWTVAEPWAQAP